MPKLQDFRQTKTITLPSFPDSQVEIYGTLIVGDIANLSSAAKDDIKTGIEMLPKFIKSWNFTDDNDQPLAITYDSIGKLGIDDVQFLMTAIQDFSKEVKKN